MKDQRTAERRQVTILNADIVNSTKLVDQLDPEELMGIMQEYFDSCRSVVEEFHGVLAGFTGDGFEAYFGYPVAREDYAVDALKAAIQIGRLLAERHETLPFDCRIGVATGNVAVDQPGIVGLGRNVLAFGSTPTLAARLQQLAKPGSILVDQATSRLCEKHFTFRDVGPVRLKGFELDHELWEVIEPRPLDRRFTLAGLSTYVGRSAELQLLLSRWQSVLAGEGQVVLLHGEAGIGKSRLVYELQKSIPRNSAAILQFQCISQFASTPLHPWIASVQRFGNILHTDSAEVRIAKIAQYLGGRLGFADEVVATCASLMGLSFSHDGDAREQSLLSMARLQDALVLYLIASSRTAPLFILVEDIQWCDASTMNLLHSLVELMRSERILLIMTSRSDKVPIFSSSHVTSLSLVKLSSGAVMELITHLTSSRRHTLDRAVAEQIRNRSDGNPLFVEELTRHYIELEKSGHLVADEANDSVPDVLQGSLMERIDKASRCKETAQLASVIEREFDQETLSALSEDGALVQQHLDILTELQIIHRMTHGSRTTYHFSHALLRDAVYSSLLNPVRRSAHRNVAEYFARDRGGVQNVPSEVIAYHYERAEDHENAFTYWLAAGQQALKAGATSEAADLLSRAGRMAALIGEREDNLRDLAAMYLSHGLALNASRGAGADPLSYFEKAEDLSARLGNTELTAEALAWQFGLHFNSGHLTASMAPALKMKQLGSDLNDRTAMAGGCQGLGMAHFMLGNFLEARREIEFGLKANEGHISGVHCYPSMSLSYLAWTLLVLGDRAAAERCADRAIESALQESSESSHALATALSNCCYVYQCMGAVDKVYERTAELVAHTTKFGEEMYLKRGTIIRCWADCVSGKGVAEPIETMNSEIKSLLGAGEEIETTFLLGVLAELQIREQRFVDAHATLSRAIAIATKNEEKFYLAELYRLRGMLALADPDRVAPTGVDYMAMAHKTAREQHAQAWIDRLPRQRLEEAS